MVCSSVRRHVDHDQAGSWRDPNYWRHWRHFDKAIGAVSVPPGDELRRYLDVLTRTIGLATEKTHGSWCRNSPSSPPLVCTCFGENPFRGTHHCTSTSCCSHSVYEGYCSYSDIAPKLYTHFLDNIGRISGGKHSTH